MKRLPILPFASTIASGERHAEVNPVNKEVFDEEYFERQHKIHQDDIPQLLTRNLEEELSGYVNDSHKDLAYVMFGRLFVDDAQGILCVPYRMEDRKTLSYLTIAYQFCEDDGTMVTTISIRCNNFKDKSDRPLLAFTAERIPDTFDIGIEISADLAVPLLFKGRHSLHMMENAALFWVKYVCIFESLFIYKSIPFKGYLYDAMLTKKGVCINPNPVCVNLLAVDGEEKLIP